MNKPILATVSAAALVSGLSLSLQASDSSPGINDTRFLSLPDAGTHVHGSHPECPLPKSALDIVRCAQEEHPSVKRAKIERDHSLGLFEVARQIPNPELELEAAAGQIEDESRSETKVAVIVPIELGGKRAARGQEAEAQQKQRQAELKQAQAEVVVETVLKLHRLRQLEQEKAVLKEAVETFSEVITQQRSRPGLAPEQRVSLSVFKMALTEAKIRQGELLEEEKALENFFHLSTGHSVTEIKGVLPGVPESWPAIKQAPATGEQLPSPAALVSHAEREISAASLQLAQAEAWPDLRIGPMAVMEKEGASSGSIFGLQLSLPLPIFQANGAGRAYASSALSRSQTLIELLKTVESHERAEWARVYERSIQALKDSPSKESLDKDHKETEAFARRGLVSASLLIEAHRQLEEIVKGRHDRELKALEALWQIHKLDGRIFSEAP